MSAPPDPDLRVERCGTCGARYNVSRLAIGSRFACRRCASVVTVGAGDGRAHAAPSLPGAPLAEDRREARRWLVAAGAVTLVGVGPRLAAQVASGPGALTDLVGLASLAAAGLVACLASVLRPRPSLLALLGALVVVALLRAHGPDGAALRADASDLAGTSALVLLGAGALRLTSRRDDARGAARPCSLAGAVLLLSTATFRVSMGETRPDLLLRADAATALLRSAGESAREGVDWLGALPTHRFALPDLALGAAAALLVLAAVVPGRRGGPLARAAGVVSCVLLLHAVLSPAAADLVADARTGAPASVGEALAHLGIDSGLALVLLGAAAFAASGGSRGTREAAPSGLLHGLAGVVSALFAWLLLAAEADATADGDLARVVSKVAAGESPLGGTSHAALVFALLAATSLLAALAPGLRRSGPLLGGVGAAVVALAAGPLDLVRALEGTPRAGLLALVVVGAGAAVAGMGAGPGPSGRRGLATVSLATVGLALLGLSVFPTGDVTDADAWIPYPCLLGTMLEALRHGVPLEAWLRDERRFVTAGSTLALLGTTLAAVVGSRRGVVGGLVVGFVGVAVALALFDPAWHAVVAATDARGDAGGDAVAAAREAVVARLPGAPAAVLLAGAALTADAIGRRR